MKILWRYTHIHIDNSALVSLLISHHISWSCQKSLQENCPYNSMAWPQYCRRTAAFFPQCLQISPLSKLLYSLALITWKCQWYHFSFAPLPLSFCFSSSSFQIWSWILVNHTFFSPVSPSSGLLDPPTILLPLRFFLIVIITCSPQPKINGFIWDCVHSIVFYQINEWNENKSLLLTP